jgi:hypothetical protein
LADLVVYNDKETPEVSEGEDYGVTASKMPMENVKLML